MWQAQQPGCGPGDYRFSVAKTALDKIQDSSKVGAANKHFATLKAAEFFETLTENGKTTMPKLTDTEKIWSQRSEILDLDSGSAAASGC